MRLFWTLDLLTPLTSLLAIERLVDRGIIPALACGQVCVVILGACVALKVLSLVTVEGWAVPEVGGGRAGAETCDEGSVDDEGRDGPGDESGGGALDMVASVASAHCLTSGSSLLDCCPGPVVHETRVEVDRPNTRRIV